MKTKKQTMDAATFIKIWQSSATFQEVMKRTGKKATYLSFKATRLRERGVPLKKFKNNTRLDTVELAKLAEKSAS